jgi:hypothetical protein
MKKMYRHWFFPSGALMVVSTLVVLSWFLGGCCPVMYSPGAISAYPVYDQPVVVYHAPAYHHRHVVSYPHGHHPVVAAHHVSHHGKKAVGHKGGGHHRSRRR